MPSKRYTEAKKLIDSKKRYTIDEAVALLKKTATTKFSEGVELHARLGIDPKKSDQQIRATISFPHGVGKTKRVVAFVEAAKEADAKAAGADIVGGEELINDIAQKEVLNFDVAVATPGMMPKLAKLAKFLGPRGLMPNPKTETVGPNVKKMVEEQKAGKQTFKNDDTGNVHQLFGRASMTEQQIKENLEALIAALRKVKPPTSKGIYFHSVTLSTSMGPGIHIDLGA